MLASGITWERFADCYPNPEKGFEFLCRQLFAREFAQDNVTLISEPNNPGVEVCPVLSKDESCMISFQSKWFQSINASAYNKIKSSMQAAINHYKGKLDKIYLYCNHDLTISGNQYKAIEKLLNSANIVLTPITNQSIFEQIVKYPDLMELYFGQFIPDKQWFEKNVSLALDMLNQRYNRTFNVSNNAELLLSFFSRGNVAIKYINSRKEKAIEEIGSMARFKSLPIKRTAIDFINSLDDVTPETMGSAITWHHELSKSLKTEILALEEELEVKKQEYANIKSDPNGENPRHLNTLLANIQEIERLISIPVDAIQFTRGECHLQASCMFNR